MIMGLQKIRRNTNRHVERDRNIHVEHDRVIHMELICQTMDNDQTKEQRPD